MGLDLHLNEGKEGRIHFIAAPLARHYCGETSPGLHEDPLEKHMPALGLIALRLNQTRSLKNTYSSLYASPPWVKKGHFCQHNSSEIL